MDENDEPLSCVLYEAPSLHGALIVQFEDGAEDEYHVAEACNIATVINSVSRILSLPRSEIACEEMTEVLLLRLDVLREYIRATFEISHAGHYSETDSDKMIRRWAGFLKHPSDYVFAHRCLSSEGATFEPPVIDIDCDFLSRWDNLKLKERDRMKADLRSQIVTVRLPAVPKLEEFFISCAAHLNKLIAANAQHLEK